MKMEMSYRDKMILMVVGVIAILAVGFILLIKPKYEAWESHKVTRDQKKTDWQAIEMKLDQIEPLKKTIQDKTDDAQKTAEIFVNTAFDNANKTYTNEKNSYQLDQYVQEAINKSELQVTSMDIGATTAKTVSYYYYTPDVVTYSLLEAADINGEYQTDVAKVMLESAVLSQRTTADVMSVDMTVGFRGTKDQMMTFLDEMNAETNAILISSIKVGDYTFKGGLNLDEQENPQFDENGNQIIDSRPADRNEEGDEEGTSDITVVLSFYNAVPIDDPVLGD